MAFELQCEGKENPLDIEPTSAYHQLRWKLKPSSEISHRKQIQHAFEIMVYDTRESSPIFCTEKVVSPSTVFLLRNTHLALTPSSQYFWKVRVWTTIESSSIPSVSSWSNIASFETGCNFSDLNSWIAYPEILGGPQTSGPVPLFKLQVTVKNTNLISRARLYSTALGLYEFSCNGKKVGSDIFAPGWTDYGKRVHSQVYALDDVLKDGMNEMEVLLGDGWFCGRIGGDPRQLYGNQPMFMCKILIHYQDGSMEEYHSDDSWVTRFSSILSSDLIDGESVDARLLINESSQWQAVKVIPYDQDLIIETSPSYGVTKQIELKPIGDPVKKSTIWGQPAWIFDFGQNMVGFVRISVNGIERVGETITLRHAEVLNTDGTIYIENLRGARAIDHYTIRGNECEEWEPKFTFHGFRYVEVTGISWTPDRDMVTGIVVCSDLKKTGEFSSSHKLINQLQSNIVWSQRGNFLDVPTDCPQRDERLGWTGDAQVFARTACFNMDSHGFFRKWFQDLADAQHEEGGFPPVAPMVPVLKKLEKDGGPAWSDAGVICPWIVYLCYGDPRVLEENYASMIAFMEFLCTSSQDFVRAYDGMQGFLGFGDWLSVDGKSPIKSKTPKDVIGTAYFAHVAQLMQKIATVLQKDDDVVKWKDLHEKVKATFVKNFVTSTGKIMGSSQTSYLLALHFDLVEGKQREAALENLITLLKADDWHLSTGFVGTPMLCKVLSRHHRTDLAYRLIEQETYPSWLFTVKHGATTMWERWNGYTPEDGFNDPRMNSFNHYAYGCIGEWLYSVVAGINLDEVNPGYKHFTLDPQPGGTLTWAKASLDSPHGLILSEWKIDDNILTYEFTVPPNTSATVTLPLPGVSSEQITEKLSGMTLNHAAGVNGVNTDDRNQPVFNVASGHYILQSEMPSS